VDDEVSLAAPSARVVKQTRADGEFLEVPLRFLTSKCGTYID
jgi:hypothetical protein